MEDKWQGKAVAVTLEKQVTREVWSLKGGDHRSEDAPGKSWKVHKVDLTEKWQVKVTAKEKDHRLQRIAHKEVVPAAGLPEILIIEILSFTDQNLPYRAALGWDQRAKGWKLTSEQGK